MNLRIAAAVLLAQIGIVAPSSAAAADSAWTYRDGNMQLVLPQGYVGPTEHAEGASVSKGFRKPYAGTALGTVILVTVHEFGPSFAQRSAKERQAITRETLDDIVAGVGRNRSDFRKGEPRPVVIAGHRGLKVAWRGSAQGIAFEGQVYCVLAGSRAYAVQIQDPVGRGGDRVAEAVRAVERMRL